MSLKCALCDLTPFYLGKYPDARRSPGWAPVPYCGM